MSKDVKRMSLEEAESFTSDQVTSAIKSCSRAYGPDSLSIFHLKNLGPLATEHLAALYNDSLKSCRLPSIWKTSLVIPIPKPDKDSSQGTSYRPISLPCPAAKVLEALILPSINEFLSPAKYQHGFRPRHSTTSALLQLTTYIETGFNQQKPPHRTVCVAIDLTAAFDTVSHDTLISKITGSSLPPAVTRCLSCYLRGRQAATSFRGTKSSTRIVVVVYPLPWPLLVGGVRCSRLWSTSQLLRPSGQQCSHSGGVCPQIQGRQCGAYVGAVEEMMCVVCVDVTEGA